MEDALISVIVPIYKAEAYLRNCVHSILAQTHTNLEVILVNDGSPDTSGAICDELAAIDHRIKVIHKSNGGVSSARNAGLDIAKGDFIAFVDSDDTIEPDMYERLHGRIAEKGADICVCGYKIISNGTVRIRLPAVYLAKKDVLTPLECWNIYFNDFRRGISTFTSPITKLIRRGVLFGKQPSTNGQSSDPTPPPDFVSR